jgi:hypothetical protein
MGTGTKPSPQSLSRQGKEIFRNGPIVDGSRDPLKFDGQVEDLLREAASFSCVRSSR